ncbi:hypothetical protein J437_LFUL012050 [Ladona fulva]|uniref:C2H2-type domain-containing protein n=1 Tax=Ladona fulva TaxID=123851 RepID=A0A8K0P387_LADFU|nr:hypothetical protein J437_LFUL012050 [Ladona fulva]
MQPYTGIHRHILPYRIDVYSLLGDAQGVTQPHFYAPLVSTLHSTALERFRALHVVMTIEISSNVSLAIQNQGKDFNIKEMESNSSVSSGNQQDLLMCSICDKQFGQPEILQLHALIHDSSEKAEEGGTFANNDPPKGAVYDKCCFGPSAQDRANMRNEFSSSLTKRSIGLTKVKLEDCLRCDECSCIYIHENDYRKHMKNFHREDSSRKNKQKKGCRSCCKQCNCRQSYKTIQKERGNNNLFHYNIKDRWSKMVSRRLKVESLADSSNSLEPIKMESESNADYSELLSRVEVSIKTEPLEDSQVVQAVNGPRGA